MKKSIKKLNMANKKDKKIKITNVAISKIPYIEYRNVEKKCNGALYFLAKYVLYLSKNHNNSNEVAITYELGTKLVGENIGISFGEEHDVDPASDTKSFHILRTCKNLAVVILHNHPSTSNISLMDIMYFIKNQNIKLIIMVTNKGNLSYIVKLSKYNNNKAIKLINEAIDIDIKAKNLKNKIKAANHFLSNCSKCGIYYSKFVK